MRLKNKDLFGIRQLSVEEIKLIMDTAAKFKEFEKGGVKKSPFLRRKAMINLFFENSTRTRTSFELAGKRLSTDVINVSIANSSVKKGETIIDTAKTLDAMNIDAYVIRHGAAGIPQHFAKHVRGAVINAGDGANEHPTQALLDAFTILEKKGTIEGLNVAIVGDIVHSRVARSNIYLLKKLGANVTLIGPNTLLPSEFEAMGVKISHKIDENLKEYDVVNILRLQLERQAAGFLPSLGEYRSLFGINMKRVEQMKDDVIIMHPGPMNRDVEISYDVADCDRQVILDQVENGVAVRMAVLYLLLNDN